MNPTAEPSVVMSYAEVQFILAEASALGWIASDPQVFYETGIRANMEFYGVDQNSIDNYLTGEFVAFESTNAIELINTQKYLTYFFAGRMGTFL